MGLDYGPWLDGAGRVVGSIEVPGIESCEVLDGSEDLVAADYEKSETRDRIETFRKGVPTRCCDIAQIVSDCGMIDERVGDHDGDGFCVAKVKED